MTTKAFVALLFLTVLYFGIHVCRWASQTWGVEAVALFLTLPALGVFGLALWGLRVERKRDAEPWVEIPWELKR